jgi:hypothetical protein
MAVTTGIQALANTLRESMPNEHEVALTAIDPIFAKANKTSFNVKQEVGRGWYTYRTIVTSLAGAYGFVSNAGDAPNANYAAATGSTGDATGTTQNIANVYDTQAASFPGAAQSATAGTTRKRIELAMATGNIFFPVTLLQGDALDESIAEFTELNMMLMAKNAANVRAAMFYKVNTSDGIAVIASQTSKTNGRYVLVIDDGRTNVFQPGMFVDIYRTTNKTNTVRMMVVSVDSDFTGTIVTLQTEDGTSVVDFADNDYIVPVGSYTYGPDGLEDWLVTSGTIYGIPIADYPQLASLTASSVGSLTGRILRQYMGKFADKMSGWVDLDTIITTGGVTREYVNSVEDLGAYQLQGAAVKVDGGMGPVSFTFDNKQFTWIESRYCKPGTLYSIKTTDGNLCAHRPPRVSSSGSRSDMGSEIQFLGQTAGSSSIFMPVTNSSGALMQYIQAPFWEYSQMSLQYPQGVKLTGLTES